MIRRPETRTRRPVREEAAPAPRTPPARSAAEPGGDDLPRVISFDPRGTCAHGRFPWPADA